MKFVSIDSVYYFTKDLLHALYQAYLRLIPFFSRRRHCAANPETRTELPTFRSKRRAEGKLFVSQTTEQSPNQRLLYEPPRCCFIFLPSLRFSAAHSPSGRRSQSSSHRPRADAGRRDRYTHGTRPARWSEYEATTQPILEKAAMDASVARDASAKRAAYGKQASLVLVSLSPSCGVVSIFR